MVLNVQVIQLAPIRVAMIRHTGAYDQIGPKFDQLWSWVTAHGVPVQRTIGIYWDNPDFVAVSQLRSAACIEVPEDFQFNDLSGLPIEDSRIQGGEYATTRFVGPYEKLAPVWTQFTSQIENNLRRQISEMTPAFEIYINDPSNTPPDQLITALYMPLV